MVSEMGTGWREVGSGHGPCSPGMPRSSTTSVSPLPAEGGPEGLSCPPQPCSLLTLALHLTSSPPVYQMLPEGSLVVSSCRNSIQSRIKQLFLMHKAQCQVFHMYFSVIPLITLPSRCCYDLRFAGEEIKAKRSCFPEHQSPSRKLELPNRHMLACCGLLAMSLLLGQVRWERAYPWSSPESQSLS